MAPLTPVLLLQCGITVREHLHLPETDPSPQRSQKRRRCEDTVGIRRLGNVCTITIMLQVSQRDASFASPPSCCATNGPRKSFVMLNDPSEWSFGCWKSISSLPILGIRTRLNIVIKEQQICLEITNVHVAIVLKSKLLCVCHLGYTFIWNWLFSVAVATILRSLCVFVIIR